MAKGSTAVWEIRPATGSDTNGGGYDPGIAGAGTDYSQQVAAQVSVADAVTNGTTTVTSATAGFTSAMVGNAVYMSGTGVTTDRYFVTGFTNSTTITVDRSPGTGTGGTLHLGGALASLTEGFSVRGGVGSNIWWTQGGTQTITAALTPPAGAGGSPSQVYGYNAARGDLDADSALYANFPIVINNNTSNNVFDLLNNYCVLKNFIADGGAGVSKSARCINVQGTNVIVSHCKATRFTTFGILSQGTGGTVDRCWVTGGISGATTALRSDIGSLIRNFVNANPCQGILGNAGPITAYNISANNTGTNVGIQMNTSGDIFSCVSYKNGGDGIAFAWAGGIDGIPRNLISYGNTGKGINVTGVGSVTASLADYNALGSNTSGNYGVISAGPHDVTLTADPFANPTGAITSLADVWANFALNNAAGGGAALKAAGYAPFLDIGALQSQASGGGGVSTPIIIGG